MTCILQRILPRQSGCSSHLLEQFREHGRSHRGHRQWWLWSIEHCSDSYDFFFLLSFRGSCAFLICPLSLYGFLLYFLFFFFFFLFLFLFFFLFFPLLSSISFFFSFRCRSSNV